MEKDSGYLRTNWNSGVVVLGSQWNYRLQISLKLVKQFDDPDSSTVEKIRIQVAGEIAQTKKGELKAYFRGYDQVLLQNLFQDLQSKLGAL